MMDDLPLASLDVSRVQVHLLEVGEPQLAGAGVVAVWAGEDDRHLQILEQLQRGD